ncbi:MAG: YitT family protein [Defluviitaleaceae bacterium]|nr:YitT family protein [Defluviitaleaceae bacterium]
MVKKSIKQVILEYLQVAVGVALLGVAIHFFFMPHNLVTGGVSGLGIIIYHYTQDLAFTVPVWMTNFGINIPLLLIAWKVLGVKFISKAIFGSMFLTLVLFLFEFVPNPLETDLLLASLFGGVLAGAGVGIAFRKGGTTGGSTLLATLIHRVTKKSSMPRILMFLDWAVILTGLFVFGPERSMYAIAAIFVSTKAMEYVLEGMNFARVCYIISQDSLKMEQTLKERMPRGVTSLDGHGVYSGQAKAVFMCVVAKNEIIKLKDIVKEADPNAFVIVTEAKEVLGQGFLPMEDKI